MKLTDAADEMAPDWAEQMRQFKIDVNCARYDPMAPDYTALAAAEPVTQNGDSRDAAEVAG